jgi:hypothetical protein
VERIAPTQKNKMMRSFMREKRVGEKVRERIIITANRDGTGETATDNITCQVTDESNLDKLSRGILRISPERTCKRAPASRRKILFVFGRG